MLFAWPVWPVYGDSACRYARAAGQQVLPPMAAGGLLSMGRVTSVLFPALLWMGAPSPPAIGPRGSPFALPAGILAVMFFTWRPLY